MIFILYIILIYFFKYNSHIDIVFLFDKLSTGLPSHHPVTAGHSGLSVLRRSQCSVEGGRFWYCYLYEKYKWVFQ